MPLYGMRTLFYRMHTMDGSGTFRIPLLFFALRRLVYLAWSFVLIQWFKTRNSEFSPDQSVLNFCSTATQLQCRAVVAFPYALPPFLVRYANRPFGHQRRYTKRLIFGWSHIMLTHISPHSIELECCCFYLSYCNRKRSQLSPFVGTADDIDIFVDFICNCWCEKIIIIILLSWCRQNPEPSVQCKFERTDLWFVLVDNDASAAVIVVDLLRVVGHRTCSMTRYSRPADGCCHALVPWLLTTADMAAERWRHCALPHSPATGQWSSTNVKRKSSCGRTRVRRSCPLN